jgi:L-alanine-DL-glutamate epimerase-like enolase superfamily enzyme
MDAFCGRAHDVGQLRAGEGESSVRIVKVEALPLSIPFGYGRAPADWRGGPGSRLNILLVRVETDQGLVGWGEAFSYNCLGAVKAAVEEMVAPLVVGRDPADIAGLHHELQMTLHLFGRYGITLFAISGLDIALWDLAAKAQGVPLCRLLGGAPGRSLPAYASLFRYGDPEGVAEATRRALAEGYGCVKLHERTVETVKAAREAAGSRIPLMLDTNCPWSFAEAREMALRLKPFELLWLEEPIFPPEDFRALARLQAETGVALAAGENACTAHQFAAMIEAGAVRYVQPSVTKVGGVTEFRKVAALAETGAVELMPHSPYFGPGFLATLHLAAALPRPGLIEWFYLDREACLYGPGIAPSEGDFTVPEGPGLGFEPDPDVIRDYAVPRP